MLALSEGAGLTALENDIPVYLRDSQQLPQPLHTNVPLSTERPWLEEGEVFSLHGPFQYFESQACQ